MKAHLFSLLLICTSAAARIVTLPDGRTYSVSDWTAPAPIEIPAANSSTIRVMKRTTVVTSVSKVKATYPIEYLYEPASKQVWLGTPRDRYFAFRARLYGARVAGTRILLRAFTAAAADRSEEEIVTEMLHSFLQGLMADDYGPNATVLDLSTVFGNDCLHPRMSMIIPKAFHIDALRVDDSFFTFSGTTLATNKIEVTIGDNLHVIAAEKNGEPVLLLSDGQRSNALKIYPNEMSIPSTKRDARVISGGSSFGYMSKDGTHHETMVRAVVNPQTGGVWFGSGDCSLALFAGQITGAEIDSQTWELLIYREFGKIPLAGDTASAFQGLTREFCDVLAGGTVKVAARIPLNRLPDLPRAEQPTFSLRVMDVRDSQLRLRMSSPWPEFVELRLDESLRVVSASLGPPGRH